MLNKLLARLNGSGTDPAALTEVLARLASDRGSAQRELEELRGRRHQALLDDVPDATLDKLERSIERQQVLLEKLELAEPAVRERLAAAKARKRGQELRDAKAALHADLEVFSRELLLPTRERAAELLARAERLGDPLAVGDITPLLAFFAHYVTERRPAFNAAMTALTREPTAATPVAMPSSSPRPPVRRPPPERPDGSLQHAVILAGGLELHAPPASAHRSTREPDDTSPLVPGEARVISLTNNWTPSAHRPATYAGQRLKMPLAAGEESARRGVAEIIERFTPPVAAQPESQT